MQATELINMPTAIQRITDWLCEAKTGPSQRRKASGANVTMTRVTGNIARKMYLIPRLTSKAVRSGLLARLVANAGNNTPATATGMNWSLNTKSNGVV